MATKRRLPLVAPSPGGTDDPEPPRPPWHWIGFGTVATFATWLPLAWIAQLVTRRMIRAALGDVDSPTDAAAALAALPGGERMRLELAIAATYVLALLLGAAAGGYLVGRWGGDRIGVREAAVGGGVAGLVAVVLSLAGGTSLAALAVVPLSAVGAAVGAARGVRRRAP
jgi:hypothetical protein